MMLKVITQIVKAYGAGGDLALWGLVRRYFLGGTRLACDFWGLKSAIPIVLALFVATVCISAAVAQPQRIEGKVTKVRDVDTIVVAGTPVRLNGVDGPETSNRYGRAAKAFMSRLVGGKVVTCNLTGDRTYDRWVGVCYLDGRDIGASAISQGHALDCARYSGGAYRQYETQAARSRLPRAGYCR